MEKTIIGRKDHADLPIFGLTNVPVKIDTGAYTSSIHCDRISLLDERETPRLSVRFFDTETNKAQDVIFTQFRTKKVRSSSGQEEVRYFVKGSIVLFEKTYETFFSLSERLNMRYPILLGRKLLKKRFIVDPEKVDLSKHQLKSTVFIK